MTRENKTKNVHASALGRGLHGVRSIRTRMKIRWTADHTWSTVKSNPSVSACEYISLMSMLPLLSLSKNRKTLEF